MRTLLEVRAGRVPFPIADRWQRRLHALRVAGEIEDVLLLLEHPHVYTLGRRFRPGHLLSSRQDLARRGVAVFEADRGGSVTYHGPGQLVAYPVLDVRTGGSRTVDVVKYIRLLEHAVVQAVGDLGVDATTRPGLTGVWVGEAKLACIGVNLSRGVSRHGVAVNVTTDLSMFDAMVPCGIPGCRITSLQALMDEPPSLGRLGSVLAGRLAGALGSRLLPVAAAELGLDCSEVNLPCEITG